MYRVIHPFYYDSGTNKYVACPGRLICLDIIREIAPYGGEGTSICRIVVSDDPAGFILVSSEEAQAIQKTLLGKSGKDALAEEVNHLTAAVRDLWNLLRARMR